MASSDNLLPGTGERSEETSPAPSGGADSPSNDSPVTVDTPAEAVEFSANPDTPDGDTGQQTKPAPEARKEDKEAAVPEKLADDEIKLPLWQRLLFRVFPKLQRS